MMQSRISGRAFKGVFLAIGCCVNAQLVHAGDIVPAGTGTQGDEQISVWVNEAPLSLFVSQLALITRRDVAIDGELNGQISGRFQGSLTETLRTVGAQYSLLFDLDENTLGVTDAAERAQAIIVVSDTELDTIAIAELPGDPMPGNSVDMGDGEIIVTGHPAFVSRTARVVTSSIGHARADSVQLVNMDAADASDIAESGAIADAASRVILDAAASEATSAPDMAAAVESEAASRDVPVRKEIRWVTDIPGYETF